VYVCKFVSVHALCEDIDGPSQMQQVNGQDVRTIPAHILHNGLMSHRGPWFITLQLIPYFLYCRSTDRMCVPSPRTYYTIC
jgi:hypothetical protein